MQDLSLPDQIFDRADDIFDGHAGIDAVLVIEIDAVSLEAFEGALDDRLDVLWSAVETTRFEVEAKLRCDDDLVAEGRERLSDELLVRIWAVDLGRNQVHDMQAAPLPQLRLVDIVGEGYDAGVRLSESIDRDMVQVRLTDEFRFVIVGTPEYLAKNGTPRRPEDLLRHECITYRAPTTGARYAWELERGRRSWRVPVRGSVVTNEPELNLAVAEQGLGLAFTFEPWVAEQVRAGRLKMVLEAYAPTVPGFFLCYPSRAQSSPALRLFVEVVKELTASSKPSMRGAWRSR